MRTKSLDLRCGETEVSHCFCMLSPYITVDSSATDCTKSKATMRCSMLFYRVVEPRPLHWRGKDLRATGADAASALSLLQLIPSRQGFKSVAVSHVLLRSLHADRNGGS